MPLRFAAPADAPALLAIYTPYVLETAITFEEAVPTEEAFAQRIRSVLEHYPYLVMEENGEILGYAYASRVRSRAAYDWSAELSVYVRKDCRGRGLGRRLYGCLLELLTLQHIHTVYGVVALPNEGSHGLHTALGFRLLERFPEMGYKMGTWWDIGWYEKVLYPAQVPPAPFVPTRALPKDQVAALLERYSQ